MSNICLILFEPLKMSRFASVLLFMIIIEESLDFLIFAFSSTADEQILTSSCLYEVSLNAKKKKKERNSKNSYINIFRMFQDFVDILQGHVAQLLRNTFH